LAIVNVEKPIVTLTTDFGLKDNYIGIIKGLISFLNRKASIIDISNEVPPFDIASGRYLLETSYLDFPPGTIHLAIVDPGVGTKRKIVIIETDHCLFVGPDNGLFSFLKKTSIRKIISVTNKKYFLKDTSPTFHGRDIMAPVTAYLSLGVIPEEFGPTIKSIMRPKAQSNRKGRGRLIYIDRFGNLVTSLKQTDLPSGKFEILLNEHKIGRLHKTFGAVKPGKPLCYINSFGYLEVGINQGSAAGYFDINDTPGAKILIAPR
jgi:S-adenosyl-L-methionine hydrolase (adenosine-forming)